MLQKSIVIRSLAVVISVIANPAFLFPRNDGTTEPSSNDQNIITKHTHYSSWVVKNMIQIFEETNQFNRTITKTELQ